MPGRVRVPTAKPTLFGGRKVNCSTGRCDIALANAITSVAAKSQGMPIMPNPPEMTPGVTPQGSSVGGLVWNILGQTYTPLQVTESSFSWHALLPPGTFVPPHIHPTQDEFIYMLDGK